MEGLLFGSQFGFQFQQHLLAMAPPWKSGSLMGIHGNFIVLQSEFTNNISWLVVYLPLWKIWKSVGMMTFRIYGKIKHVSNHQPVRIFMKLSWNPSPSIHQSPVACPYIYIGISPQIWYSYYWPIPISAILVCLQPVDQQISGSKQRMVVNHSSYQLPSGNLT